LLLQVRRAGIEDHVLLEVEDLLEVAQRHVEELPDAARQPLEEPDVRHWRGELDVPPPLAAHPRPGDLDSALVADDAGGLQALVLAAGALVVLGRAEDTSAEESIPLRLERSVVDGLRLLDLAARPDVPDLLGRRQPDADRVERDGLRVAVVKDPPQVLRGTLFPDQTPERPIRQHSLLLHRGMSPAPSNGDGRRPGAHAGVALPTTRALGATGRGSHDLHVRPSPSRLAGRARRRARGSGAPSPGR